jgi:flagellar motor component MotA
MKHKFIVEGGGDMDVGICPSNFTVTFEGFSSCWMEENDIKFVKDMLKELDDNGATVYTEEEYNEILKMEEEHHKEMALHNIENMMNDKCSKKEILEYVKSILGVNEE